MVDDGCLMEKGYGVHVVLGFSYGVGKGFLFLGSKKTEKKGFLINLRKSRKNASNRSGCRWG